MAHAEIAAEARPVAQWFEEFVIAHRARFHGAGLPDHESGQDAHLFWDVWFRRFQATGVSAVDAMEASRRLAESPTPPDWPREHLPRLMRVLAGMHEERKAEAIHRKAQDDVAATRRRAAARDRWDALPRAEQDRLVGAKARECGEVQARFLTALVLQDLEAQS
jgi:hypothetical protein